MLRTKRRRALVLMGRLLLALSLMLPFLSGATVGMAAMGETKPVDMEFVNASLVQVLQMLAESAGYNVLLDDSVQGAVTFTLRDVRPLEALELVTSLKGYSFQIVGNTIVVGAAVRAPSPPPSPIEVELYRVQHVSLDGAANLVRELYPDLNVIVDPGTGSLILRGPGGPVSEASAFLLNYDRPTTRALQFQSASVEAILWELAGRAQWNLVIEGGLQGDLTANLEGMDFKDALELVGDAAGLHYRLNDKVLFVSQPVPEAVPEPSKEIAIFRLDHINANKTAQTLSSIYPDLDVDVNDATRTLTVAGTGQDLAAASKLLRQLDVPSRQVIVEARLEEIHINALERLGVEWDMPTFRGDDGAASAALTWSPTDLKAVLDALAEQGSSNILASPKIAAIDGEMAHILIGDRVPILIRSTDTDGRVTEAIEFFEAGIMLEITPIIGGDNSVTLDIFTEVSSITGRTPDGIPELRTREASTRVRVQDGQPLVIGGLIEEQMMQGRTGIPFLGDLPLLGRLFSRTVEEELQTEMVIFLIPHIVHDGPESVSTTSSATSDSSAGSPNTASVSGSIEARTGFQGASGQKDAGVPGLTRSSDSKKSQERRIAWTDPVAAVQGAYDFRLEKRVDQNGFLTGLYVSAGADGISYGGNIGFRHYLSEMGGIVPWAGVDGEYLTSSDGSDRGYSFAAAAGIGIREANPLLVELFGQYTLASESLNLPSSRLPARWEGLRIGLRLGWEY